MVIARHLADSGYDVVLRNPVEEQGVRSADAYLIGEHGCEIWEFKRVWDSATNFREAVRRAFREGRRQAPRVLVFRDRTAFAMDNVNRAVERALFLDVDRRLLAVAILLRDGTLQVIERKAFDNGRRFR